MKTEAYSINDLLAKTHTTFFIPPFQRSYAWGKQEIERFFSDITKIIDSELDFTQVNKQEHFFGTLVVKEELSYAPRQSILKNLFSGFKKFTGSDSLTKNIKDEKYEVISKTIIVDGQQRLTTALIFLIALRDTEKEIKKKNYITDTYLINPFSSFEYKIKLKQVTKDWEAYKALIMGENPYPGIITSAYNFLKKLIQELKRSNPSITTEHFLTAIKRFNVAVIFLDEAPNKGEDPQVIFETLNSLGKPLSLSDLIRNFVLLKLQSEKQNYIYEKIWYPKIEDILKENTSEFFRDYLQYKISAHLKVISDNNTKELYQLFKSFFYKHFLNIDNFITEILKYVKLYKWIITESFNDNISDNIQNDKIIKELLRNIFIDIKSQAFKPFVLGLLEYHQYGENDIKLTDEQLISMLETIRTYLIRRRILGLNNSENKHIISKCKLIQEIIKNNTPVIDILTKMPYDVRFPNDLELKEALTNMNFYEELKKYSKFILGKIEENNSNARINFREKHFNVVHIMPLELSRVWKNDLGDDYEIIHKEYLHNIGNLIFTDIAFEKDYKSFQDLKQKLQKSKLFSKNDIITKDKWDLESILDHQKNMIKWLLNTFPLPENFRKSNNWITQIDRNVWISPQDDDASERAEGNKPTELRILNVSIEVKTWVDVYLNFLKFIIDNQPSNLSIIIENQQELFGKNDAIIKWPDLKEKGENNKEFLTRYKTLDNKTYDKIDNLNDDTLFFHTNMSANTCMLRISNIMNKFYLDSDSVKIKLKK